MKIAVQLYTIREETQKDFAAALEKVAKIGYEGVEFAGYGDLPASRMKSYLDGFGLTAAGSHVGYDLLVNKLEEVIEYNLEIGNRYIVCPWKEYKGRDDFLRTSEVLEGIGRRCRQSGLQFGYHNHAHELKMFEDGDYGLDLMYSRTDPDILKAEIDVYWVSYAGLDPVLYLRKYSGRCPVLHLKDMEEGKEKSFTEVGNGVIDMQAIVEEAKRSGVQWLVVEQDVCKISPIESITISYENIRKML